MPIALNALTSKFVPNFRSGHTRYVDYVKASFRDGCRWLDAGGGHQIFHDVDDGERELVERARQVVVCDFDGSSLVRHVSVKHRVRCDLAKIPLASNTFDFVTCGMVAEHLSDPATVIAELARVLAPGGRLIIHTVNLWSYPTLLSVASQAIPDAIRGGVVARVTGREADDVFPAYYRCNTRRQLSGYLRTVGLHIEDLRFMHSSIVFRSVPPLWPVEIALMRVLSRPALAPLQAQILVTAHKPSRPAKPRLDVA